MGFIQPPQRSLNPKWSKFICERELYDNGDASVVTCRDQWLTKHPSALHTFEQMMKIGEGKQIVVFLDYDGTLSPIVNEPHKAFMTDQMRSAVDEVAKCFPTAIVTGRSRDKAVEFVKLKDLCYAGSHGMHISIPSRFFNTAQPQNQAHIADEQGFINFYAAKKFLHKLKKIKEKLQEKTKGIRGAIVEDNKFCISVHFRCVDEENVDNVKKIVDSVIKSYPNFRKGEGNKFIKKLGRGFPIIVSSMPKRTDASFSLRDTTEVMDFLTKLVGWRRRSSSD